jgi:hypothetical protein
VLPQPALWPNNQDREKSIQAENRVLPTQYPHPTEKSGKRETRSKKKRSHRILKSYSHSASHRHLTAIDRRLRLAPGDWLQRKLLHQTGKHCRTAALAFLTVVRFLLRSLRPLFQNARETTRKKPGGFMLGFLSVAAQAGQKISPKENCPSLRSSAHVSVRKALSLALSAVPTHQHTFYKPSWISRPDLFRPAWNKHE